MTTESNNTPMGMGAHSNEPEAQSIEEMEKIERHKKAVELSEALGLNEINQKLTLCVKAIENHETALIQVAKFIETANKQTQEAQTPQGKKPPANLAEQLNDNQDIIFKLMDKVFPAKKEDTSAASEFLKTINEKSQHEALESLDIVSLINKKVKGKLVQDIAGDIAETVAPPAAAVVHAPG